MKPRSAGYYCDEYPFGTTVEGGVGTSARLVPADEQRFQGSQLRWFYAKCKVARSPIGGPAIPDSEFTVVADFDVPTGYSCKSGISKPSNEQ